MSSQKAIVIQGHGKAKVVTDRPVPALRPSYVRVAVKAVALNPTDWKHIKMLQEPNQPGFLSGCDFAGVVEEVGTGYEKQWKVGDRVAGLAHGGNLQQPEDGAFAEHIVAKADILIRIPDNMPFEAAAALPVGVFTCGQGLYQTLSLNLPNNPTDTKEPILIYAGSTATGLLGIQFAKISGYRVITTCSPRNFEYVKSLRVDAAYDYKDPDCADRIIEFAGGKIDKVWDTVGGEGAIKVCSQVIKDGGHFATIAGTSKVPNKGVKNSATIGYTVTGEHIDKGWFKKEDTREEHEFAKKFALIVEKLLADGKLKPQKQRISEEGLDGVLDGLSLLENNKVSGEKLVYTL